MVIQFSHPKPREYLLKHGRVYTFRAHKRKRVGKNWASAGRMKPKIADVNITYVKRITVFNLASLKYFVKDSGFKLVTEWMTAIMKLTKSKEIDGHLYLVEVI